MLGMTMVAAQAGKPVKQAGIAQKIGMRRTKSLNAESGGRAYSQAST